MKSLIRNLYLHFPFCNLKCRYCDFPVHALGLSTDTSHKELLMNEYIDKYLKREIDVML